MDKFSKEQIEQIEAAAKKINYGTSAAEMLIAELTQPKWKPQDGEVYKNPNGNYYKQKGGFKFNPEARPLTPGEVPAWERDKAALKVAIEAIQANITAAVVHGWREDEMKEALAKIKELTG